MKHSKKGFTLVELVVVAVILSILATVGFISYEEYITDTRDSKRLAQLTGLRDGLRLGITKGQLPLPDDSVEIRNNGTPFLYQGYAGKNVLEGISYSEATKDPFDDTYYTYLLSRNRKDFQLLGFLEEYNPSVISSILPESYAAVDYSQRFPQTMGKKLGIVLEQETNTPLQEMPEYSGSGYMDLQDTTTNLFDAYITDSYLISGKESDLIGIIPYTTCKKIKETADSYGNGIYNINPSGLDPFEVYCNMEIDEGGWTLVARTVVGGVGSFGWLVEQGNIRDNSQPFSFGDRVLDLGFSEIMLASYTTGNDIVKALKVGVDKTYVKDSGNFQYMRTTQICTEIYPLVGSWMSACDVDGEDGKVENRNSFNAWGNFHNVDDTVRDTYYFFDQNSGSYSSNTTGGSSNQGIAPNGFADADGIGNADGFGDFYGEQGMIFVR